MMSLQSSLVGFAVFKALEHVLDIPFGPAENVVLQSTAVATATMPLAGGFVGILPALGMLEDDESQGARTTLNYGQLCAWGLALTFFGVFFAVPLRKQTIIKEKLRFPSGTATAQMISVLHKRPDPTVEQSTGLVDDIKWVTKLLMLFGAFVASGIYAVLAYLFPIVTALPVFGRRASEVWAWNLMPSLSYAGQGIIMGLPTCVWMLVGAIVGWGILSPLAKNEEWAPGPVADWKTGSRGWILWISLAVMISESVVSLGIVGAKEVLSLYRRFKRHSQEVADQDEVESRFLVPQWVTWGGLAASALLCMCIVKALFDVPLYDTLVAVGLALPLAVLGVRALGETDLNPVSGIGKISQVVFAGIMPGNLVGNLVAGGIAEAGAQQAGDLMQDLKTGHLLNASPRAQFSGQIIGSVFSVFVTAGAYLLYNRVYTIPGPQLPVPTAQVWLDMARLVNGHPLPPHVWPFIVGFSLLFFALPVVLAVAINNGSDAPIGMGRWQADRKAVRKWWPSGIAFAIGIYNTPNFTLMRVIGSVVAEAVTEAVVRERRRRCRDLPDEAGLRRKLNMLAIILASGFVLGEGTLSFFILLAQAVS